jgi:hypothetical protein
MFIYVLGHIHPLLATLKDSRIVFTSQCTSINLGKDTSAATGAKPCTSAKIGMRRSMHRSCIAHASLMHRSLPKLQLRRQQTQGQHEAVYPSGRAVETAIVMERRISCHLLCHKLSKEVSS